MDSDFQVDGYAEALERGKFLKKAELSDIPDDKLEWVVMSWLFEKEVYKIVDSIPKPCLNVFSCQVVTTEINNGGIHQLFRNDMAQSAEWSIDGFLDMGSPKLSDVMVKALELYKKHDMAKAVELIQRNGKWTEDPTVRRFFDFHRDNIFCELDNAFYQECDSVDYVKYIRRNADCFGD